MIKIKEYCYDCNQMREFVPVLREEEVNIRGELITGTLTCLRCSECGLEYIANLTTPGLEAIYNEYRPRKSLPGPKEIRRLRMGMGQEEFAVWVEWSVEDLHRYENGVIIRERDAAMLAALDVPVPKVQLERVC